MPAGWTATLLGGGQPVAAALPATNASVSLELAPRRAQGRPVGTTNLTVNAQGRGDRRHAAGGGDAGQGPAGQAHAQSAAAGAARHLEVELRVPARHQERQRQEGLLVSLSAQAPQNFDTTFTEQYGSQELTALPLDAGQSKDVKLKVQPPNTIAAGKYKVTAKVVGRGRHRRRRSRRSTSPASPSSSITGREGLLSARADGRQGKLDPGGRHQYGHRGGRADRAVGHRARAAGRSSFEPKTIDRIAPNENKEVQALITPTGKAIAGDYVTTLRASARGESWPRRRSASRWPPRRSGASSGVGIIGDRAAGHGRRSRMVRPAMSESVIEAQGPHQALQRDGRGERRLVRGRSAARSSACSAPTAPARPPPS